MRLEQSRTLFLSERGQEGGGGEAPLEKRNKPRRGTVTGRKLHRKVLSASITNTSIKNVEFLSTLGLFLSCGIRIKNIFFCHSLEMLTATKQKCLT